MNILYIHPFPVFGGATKSLTEMISALPPGAIKGVALSPRGIASESLKSSGINVIEVRGLPQWDDTRYGHYHGLRWLILIRELLYLPSLFSGLWRARALGPYSLIHCNEITALLAGVVAKKWLRAPLLVHVRSLQRINGGRISKWLMRMLRQHANKVIAIDEAVKRSLPSDLDVTVVHNGLKTPKFMGERDRNGAFTIAIIGVLGKLKGVYEFVEAARILHERNVDVRMVVVGENARKLSGAYGWLLRKLGFAQDVRTDLEVYVKQHGLTSIVEFSGFVVDINKIYSRLDALCFPSHLDAPGRPVFEAALYGLPSIVAMKNPTCDVVIDGKTGLCIDNPDPKLIAASIEILVNDRCFSRKMGETARVCALSKFDSVIGAKKFIDMYKQLNMDSIN